MAEENNEVKVEKSSSPITKIILFGVPAFIVQLILVYFITANILMNKAGGTTPAVHGEEVATEETSKAEGGEGEAGKSGQFIYAIDEIIVNPAKTNGRQLLLTSLAFDMPSEASKAELEGKDFLVKDMIISVLSGKTTKDLSDIEQRDSLRNEIATKIEGFLPDIKINKVYFSKFILQ
ncbi:MAG: flagellar basal body-associated FliL family protein [Bacteroidetes bacterium]|nr:flagellar basal body-associated FliL family protein [Bacteroidota bacterium]MBU1116620.1 flagellar basal body-associated FliL family protein [Bacteroidota bacterium]MBU1797737.1 flagellar basal body-associated FliL family protein [Bacteroidota bacterium]